MLTNTSLSLISSTGRASNLTSPTADFSPDISSAASKPFPAPSSTSDTKTVSEDVDGVSAPPEKIKHSSSSIIGLRAATFDSGSKTKTEEVTEDKPRPPPKPRPWSIVGVDRKSGEYTQVEASGQVTPGPEPELSDEVESEESEARGDTGRRGSAVNRGGSVRDMIANLNKPEKETSGTVGGLLGGQSVRDRIASMNNQGSEVKKKGNSLPRSGVAEAINPAAGSKSPGVKAKASPHNFRKESTTDDPRIMKLDDDFMYEDSVNV